MRRFLPVLTLLCLFSVVSLLAGCRASVQPRGPRGPRRAAPRPAAVHVHNAHCGHHWHGGRWHHMSGHVHGPGCGHLLRGGRWVLIIR